MRVFAYLSAQQARRAACGLGAAWLAVTLALAAALLLEAPAALTAGAWLELCALAFAPALAVAMPLSVVAHALRVAESGEGLAVAAGGGRRATVLLALVAPWLPLLVGLDVQAHTIRPAAVAALGGRVAQALHADPSQALQALTGAGVAGSRHGEGLRLLVPVGGRGVGIELQRLPQRTGGGSLELGGGRVQVLPEAGQPPLALRFDGASLHLPPPAPALGTLDVAELATDFVERRRDRIERARALQRRAPLRESWPRERRRRELTAPCALLALGLAAAAALPRQPSPQCAWLLFGLPAVAVAMLGAGAVAAW